MSKKSLIVLAAIGSLAVAVAVAYVALTVSSSNSSSGAANGPQPGQPPMGRQAGGGEFLSSALEKLVDDGTITADQEQAIEDAFANARPQGGGAQSPPDAGAQGESAGGGQNPPASGAQGAPAAGSNPFSGVLDDLVSNGTLTEKQAQAVEDALTAARPTNAPGSPPPGT